MMAQNLPIERKRGDTYRIRITFTQSDGSPLDLTNSTLKMTVSPIAAPDESHDALFEIAGSIVAPATDGVADFELTGTQADNVGDFYYDVEMTDVSGSVRTILEGPFVMTQDITKSDEEFEWTPDADPSDGEAVPIFDNSTGWLIFNDDVLTGEFTYETRDTRRVIRDAHVPVAHAFDSTGWMAKGPDIPRHLFSMPGWEFQITAFLKLAYVSFEIQDGCYYHSYWSTLDTRTGTPSVAAIAGTLYEAGASKYSLATPSLFPDTAGWVDEDWYKLGVRVQVDGTVEFMVKPEADPDDWIAVGAAYSWHPAVTPIHAPNIWTRRVFPENAAAVFDLWKYEWRRL